MKILAIETSCDDTGIAILEVENEKFTVLSNVVSSQQIHANYGGVFPMMAKREHQKNLVPVLTEALKTAGLLNISRKVSETGNSPLIPLGELPVSETQRAIMKEILEKEDTLFESVTHFLQTHEKPNIDAIAVTHGPGLEPCLWVGTNFAKVLSLVWEIPIIPVNHIEAHILVNFLPKINENSKSQTLNPKTTFPAISLVVSGGHTQLILVKGIPTSSAGRGNYEIIGETRDDAAGECFDKAARILGLGYPGGPIISKIAAGVTQSPIQLPRPMLNSKDYDFSFSGLKTAVLYKVRDMQPKEIVTSKEFIKDMCFSVQDAICDVLIKKTLQAAKDYNAKSIILGGGVSANSELKKQFTEKSEIPVIFPNPKLSTDNGLMIAVAGYFNRNKKTSWKNLEVNANLRLG